MNQKYYIVTKLYKGLGWCMEKVFFTETEANAYKTERQNADTSSQYRVETQTANKAWWSDANWIG